MSISLDDAKVVQLWAWISAAFEGDDRFNNLMLAFAAIFGEHPPGSPYSDLVDEAMSRPGVTDENLVVGSPYSIQERERGTLGAMGAGQWTGQFRTRPHGLLDVRNFSSVSDWSGSLPRGCRRTLARAQAQNFTVTSYTIPGSGAAPHSTLSHFRCVMEHEVRLLASGPSADANNFFSALGEAIGRYQNCASQAGEIREYRDEGGRVVAFAQEARKGRVMRGQWFYATDDASKRYVWFHSVQECVRRAIETEGVDMVDLGPSGTDAFSELKEKYGFASVADWHTVADYRGPFVYENGQKGERWRNLDPPDYLFGEGSRSKWWQPPF